MTLHNKKLGLLLVLGIAIVSIVFVNAPGIAALTLSPLIVAILLGMFIGNIGYNAIPQSFRDDIVFAQTKLLRLGIILYGFRLSLYDIADIGLIAIIITMVVVFSTLLLGYFIGRKILKMDRETTFMTTIGSAICGAAAVMAAKNVVKAESHQVYVAIATVVVFGTIAMFLYPFLNYWLGFDDFASGIYTGATVHEVAQVVVAGNAISPETGQVAVVVKLTRVIMLAPAILLVSFYINWRMTAEHVDRYQITIPWFIVGFIIAVAINSIPGFPQPLVWLFNHLDILLLTTAMAALGIETNIIKLARVGLRPFILALLLFIYLMVSGYFLTVALVPF